MTREYFRFNFKGKEGSRNNSFITLKHERPDYGEVTVGISQKEDDTLRSEALDSLYILSKSLDKRVRKYSWDYHDAVLVETGGFDTGLGVLFSSRLEKQGVVPKGSTEKFKMGLRNEGHVVEKKDIAVFMGLIDGDQPILQQKINDHDKKIKEKKRLFPRFRKSKPGHSK